MACRWRRRWRHTGPAPVGTRSARTVIRSKLLRRGAARSTRSTSPAERGWSAGRRRGTVGGERVSGKRGWGRPVVVVVVVPAPGIRVKKIPAVEGWKFLSPENMGPGILPYVLFPRGGGSGGKLCYIRSSVTVSSPQRENRLPVTRSRNKTRPKTVVENRFLPAAVAHTREGDYGVGTSLDI